MVNAVFGCAISEGGNVGVVAVREDAQARIF